MQGKKKLSELDSMSPARPVHCMAAQLACEPDKVPVQGARGPLSTLSVLSSKVNNGASRACVGGESCSQGGLWVVQVYEDFTGTSLRKMSSLSPINRGQVSTPV